MFLRLRRLSGGEAPLERVPDDNQQSQEKGKQNAKDHGNGA
jgi:hypothetical protein